MKGKTLYGEDSQKFNTANDSARANICAEVLVENILRDLAGEWGGNKSF